MDLQSDIDWTKKYLASKMKSLADQLNQHAAKLEKATDLEDMQQAFNSLGECQEAYLHQLAQREAVGAHLCRTVPAESSLTLP